MATFELFVVQIRKVNISYHAKTLTLCNRRFYKIANQTGWLNE